jgi:hypothetical protein
VHGSLDLDHLLCDQETPHYLTTQYRLSGAEVVSKAVLEDNKFASPERLSGQLTPSCDIFALGMIVYFLQSCNQFPQDTDASVSSTCRPT